MRSNLIPACHSCNHSKGSEHWLHWFERQDFYNETAKELIEEWISNRRFIEEELGDGATNYRAAVRSNESEVRGEQNEPPSFGENCLAPA